MKRGLKHESRASHLFTRHFPQYGRKLYLGVSAHCLYPHLPAPSQAVLLFLSTALPLSFHPTEAKRMGYSGPHPRSP